MLIFPFIFFLLLIHSLLLALSCTSWLELSASLHTISCLSSANSCHGSAWLTPCSAQESTVSLRSEVSVCEGSFIFVHIHRNVHDNVSMRGKPTR